MPVGRTVLLSRLLYWLNLNKMIAVRRSTASDGYLRANTSREGHGWPCSHEECVMGFIYIPYHVLMACLPFTSNHHHLMAYCVRCARSFPHDRALEQHKSDSNSHWPCDDCNRDFASYEARQQHYVGSGMHHYCGECDRHFQNENNIRQHMNSKIHQAANLRCPGRGCNKSFVSLGALTLHFESDTCPSGMTREELNRFVVRKDTKNYITNRSRLLTGPLGWKEPPPTKTTWATDLSWNGAGYECFLCDKTFGTLARLNQHLQSPRHEAKIYKCPKPDCRIEFVTLSGLCQHVEGGSCGVRNFRKVRITMETLTGGFKRLTV